MNKGGERPSKLGNCMQTRIVMSYCAKFTMHIIYSVS